MSTEQLPSGTSGNAPVYILVSAPTQASMSDDKSGEVAFTPQPQQQNQQTTPISVSSTLCGSLPMTPVHPQVALVNTVNHVAMSSKELPGQISNQAQIRVIPSMLQTVGNENTKLTTKIQPHPLSHPQLQDQSQPQPQQQVQSATQFTSQPSQVRQQFQNISNDSSTSVVAPMLCTNDEVGTQLLALLGALQQRQQQRQQQQQQQQSQSGAGGTTQPLTQQLQPLPPKQPQPQSQQQQQTRVPPQQPQPLQPSQRQLQQQQPPPPPPPPLPPQQQQHQQHQLQQPSPQQQPQPPHQLHQTQSQLTQEQQSQLPQHQSQHVIMSSHSELVDNAAVPTPALNQATLPTQLLQMQQSLQSGQDIGQVGLLQAVLSQTAAMQGNLTTILSAITTLMQQQNQQQLQQQMKQEQVIASVTSPQTPAASAPSLLGIVSQAGLDAIPTFSNACKSFPSCGVQPPTPSSLDSSLTSNSFIQSQPITSVSCVNSPVVHSSISIFDPSVSFAEPLHSVSMNSSQTSTVASNFGHDIEGPGSTIIPETPKPSSLPSSQPPLSMPMDVDALLQHIFGDAPKHFDPVLGSAKFDVQESLVSQTPVMSASVSSSNNFVDSLLNQPSTTEGRCATGVERQSSQNNASVNNNNSSGNNSTLRSLLTENSWLNPSTKPSESIIMNSDAVSSDSALYSNSSVTAVNRLSYLPTSANEHIAKPSPLTFDTNEEDQTSQTCGTQLDKNPANQHHLLEVQSSASIQHQPIDEVSDSSTQQHLTDQCYQEEHRHTLDEQDDQQHQTFKLRKLDEESQHSVDFKPFNNPSNNLAMYSKGDLSLRKAREGDSSGDESSPSCSPSSSRCGSPYMSRNSPDFTASEVICQDSDTQMSVIRRYHDMHIGSCSDSAMDELPSGIHGAPGDQGLCLLPTGSAGISRSASGKGGGSNGGTGYPCSTDDPLEATEDDTDEMQPAAKQRRGINQTHVSDLCTTDEESNHGNYMPHTPWPSSSHVSSPTTLPADLSSDAGNTASPPLIVSQTPRLSGSGASLIVPVSVPTSSEPVFPPTTSHRKIARLPSLSIAFSARNGSCELMIIEQPEEQHRARYMTEGSRGAVKDRSGQGHPVVQLLGWNQPATLQVFVGTDVGRVKPHGFYQACKVSGKNSTPCKERNFDGTNVIEIQFDPKKDMKLSIDCVGILKLRNADVEQRVGLHKTKKSTKARMVFRVNIPRGDGSYSTLQTFTEPILCTQPIGSPEISRISLTQASCRGGTDLFIIGKNFAKGTKVIFQEVESSRETVVWEKDAPVETEFLGQSHLICTIPPYRNMNVTSPVSVQIMVKCNGRISEPHVFAYKPDVSASDQLTWDSILSAASNLPASCAVSSSLANSGAPAASISSFVSPVAVELNKLVQVKSSGSLDFLGAQALSSTLSSGGFQLPLASPKVSSASPSAAGSVAGGPASVVSSGPDSVSSNPCVISGEGPSCDLNLISAMKSSDGTPLTSRDSVGQSTSVPGSNASGNTDSPAPEVGVEHMDWTKLELPVDLAGNSDDFNFLTELSSTTMTDGTDETASSLPQKKENGDIDARQNGPFFMQ